MAANLNEANSKLKDGIKSVSEAAESLDADLKALLEILSVMQTSAASILSDWKESQDLKAEIFDLRTTKDGLEKDFEALKAKIASEKETHSANLKTQKDNFDKICNEEIARIDEKDLANKAESDRLKLLGEKLEQEQSEAKQKIEEARLAIEKAKKETEENAKKESELEALKNSLDQQSVQIKNLEACVQEKNKKADEVLAGLAVTEQEYVAKNNDLSAREEALKTDKDAIEKQRISNEKEVKRLNEFELALNQQAQQNRDDADKNATERANIEAKDKNLEALIKEARGK